MALDPVRNFAVVSVANLYDSTAVTVVLATGGGARLPDPSTEGPFNLTWWESGSFSNPADDPNVEIVRCTAVSGDTITITRGQESTSAANHNTVGRTFSVLLAFTKKSHDDINTHLVSTSNPHSVTKTQVGLGNVDNLEQIPLSYLDIDTLLATNSDIKVASQKAVKTYIDSGLATKEELLAYVPENIDNKSANIMLGVSDIFYPTQKAVKSYVDTGLATKENTIITASTQLFYRGDKTFASPTPSDVGLGSVDNVQQIPMSYLDVDGTLASNSDVKVASQKAIRTYVATGLSTKQDSLGYTAENVANKDTDGTLTANSDTKYASQKAIKTYTDTNLALKENLLGFTPENVANKDTDNTLTANSDTKYASQKAIKAYVVAGLATKEGTITAGTTGQYWRGDKSWQTLDKSVVGLNNVTNDSQVKRNEMGVANGVATLDSGGVIPITQIPSITISHTYVVANEAAMLALSAFVGDIAIRTDISETYILAATPATVLANWKLLLSPPMAVSSVNGLTGNVVLTTTEINEGTNLYYTDARVQAYSDVNYEPIITAGISSQYWRGDKSWQTLNATAVGLGSVDNLQQLPMSYLDTDTSLTANSDAKVASQKATKTYVDTGLATKLTPNAPIVAATKTKITYDTNGLITVGADATTADIAGSTNKRYVTDADLVILGNTSNSNTGDQDLSGLVPYTGATGNVDLGAYTLTALNLTNTNTGDQDLSPYALISSLTDYLKFAAAFTFYVSKTGSDSNDGLTSGTAFLTIQHGLDSASKIRASGFIIINIGDGTYQENLILPPGTGILKLIGNATTRANVILKATTTSNRNITHKNNNWWLYLDGMTIQDGQFLLDLERTRITIGNVLFKNYYLRGISMGAYTVVNIDTGYAAPAAFDGGNVGNNQAINAFGYCRFVCNVTFAVTNTITAVLAQNYAGFFFSSSINVSLTGSSLGLAFRSGSQISFAGSIVANSSSLISGGVSIQLFGAVATINAGTTFSLTNWYYGIEMDQFSQWNEGNTCTFSYTNVTKRAFLSYTSAYLSNNNFGTTPEWFKDYPGGFAVTYGFDQRYLLASTSGLVYLTTAQALTNKTITDATNNVTANSLRSATTTVSVSAAAAPSAGQVLMATNSTTATWQNYSSGIVWAVVTGDTSMAVDNGYLANKSSQCILTLPATAAVGKSVRVAGMNVNGWKITQNASGIIHFGNKNTTTGTGGYISSTNTYDAVELVCVVADNEWSVISSTGNITIV